MSAADRARLVAELSDAAVSLGEWKSGKAEPYAAVLQREREARKKLLAALEAADADAKRLREALEAESRDLRCDGCATTRGYAGEQFEGNPCDNRDCDGHMQWSAARAAEDPTR